MPVEHFRTDFPAGVRHRLLGSTLNRMNGAINTPLNGYPVLAGTTGPGMAGINVGGGMAMMPAQMTHVGVAIVTDDADTCPDESTEFDGKWGPCRSNKKYLAKWRKWSHTTGTWVTTDEEEYAVDLGVYWGNESEAMTTGPILLVDDIFPAWLDPMRGMLVPLWVPTEWFGKADDDIAAGGTGTVSVWKRTVAGVLEDTERDIPECFSPAVDISAGDYVAVAWVGNTMFATPLVCS